MLNLSKSYCYPFQLQNSSSSSVSCFIAPTFPFFVPLQSVLCSLHFQSMTPSSFFSYFQKYLLWILPTSFVPYLVLDGLKKRQATIWPTMSNFEESWRVFWLKFNLNWELSRIRLGHWGTQQQCVWRLLSPGTRRRPSGEMWYARWLFYSRLF